MKPSEVKSIRGAGTLEPVKEASLQFCICKQLSRKDWLELNKLIERAVEETETLTSQKEQNEREASKRMEAYCKAILGEDAYDLKPISFPFLMEAKG